MNIISEALAGATTRLQKLELALNQELTGGKSKLEADFREAYPVLEQYLTQRMRKRAVMERFNAAYGYELVLAQFRKILNAERSRRSECGDLLACSVCNRTLHEPAQADEEEV
ncbi:hypothetical protein H9654_08770 [Stenotrophomonas sp. Sa5BUN4]|uniref:Uncharacterized protein n=1 Tax=Stenotrophomonas lacuserhaii TaxID=2760084 RepID=A0A8X8FLU5_9GAMM|nr:hypothetical protein [Stenotrophomonas pennii]MBD7954298.1 hypothetical protein [Stenotrophomonas pennii]